MLPRKPSVASFGPTVLTAVASMPALLLIEQWCRAESYIRSTAVSICSCDTDDRSKTHLSQDAPRGPREADAPADHRERRGAARGARPCADLDQRHRRPSRRSPLDGVPPLPRRRGAVRSLLVALRRGEPAARSEHLGGDRGARGAHRDRAARALRVLWAHEGDVHKPPARRAPRPDHPAPARRLLRLPARDRGHPDARPRTARRGGPPDARGNRPRTRVLDLALPRPRA